ncbi:hypothetical protein MJ585_14985 [Klebsiella pneumoniae]|nr:hypothetical protein MJ585_14985 [Klebsiella pneumoniae]
MLKALQAMVTPPDGCCFVNRLRNHDELIRGIGERNKRQVIPHFAPDKSMSVYQRGVRRRLAPMLDGDTRRQLPARVILLTLPAPVMRYGDEIGGYHLSHRTLRGQNADAVVSRGQRRLFPGGADICR